MRSRILTSVLAGAFALTLAACGQSANTGSTAPAPGDNAGATIGIAMPTKSSERWIGDGDNMVKQFEAKGYKTDLQYGDNIVENQVSQIENMITKGDRLLVIAAIDGSALSDVLQRAKDAGISVISYDRLIRESPNVDYYATFDNFQVGVLQGTYIAEKLGLATATTPKTVELFAGSPDDNNAQFFFDGAMSILQPFIDNGTLSVASGQTDFTQAATLRWDGGVAQTRMDNLLSGSYSDKNLDAVLSPYDGISIGVLSSLKGVGYGAAGKPMPIVTGQDAELASVKSINAGEQTQTVYKDTRELARIAVEMGDAILTGGTPPVNDTEQYDNGVKVVPSYLLEPVNVDKSNITDVLVGGGYYTAEQIAG